MAESSWILAASNFDNIIYFFPNKYYYQQILIRDQFLLLCLIIKKSDFFHKLKILIFSIYYKISAEF